MTTLAAIVISTVVTGSLSQLWGLINGLQLVVHLPLVGKTEYPGITQEIIEKILTVAQFDIIDLEALLFSEQVGLQMPKTHDEFQIPTLARVKYMSLFTISNLGTIYLLVNLFFLEAAILMLVGCFCMCSPLAKIAQKLKRLLFWNQFLRLFVEASLEAAVVSIYNLHVYYKVAQAGQEWYEPDNFFFMVNLATTIAVTVLILAYPAFVLCYYLPKFSRWNTHKFDSSFGSVLDSLRKDSKLVIGYPLLFIVRRVSIAMLSVLL